VRLPLWAGVPEDFPAGGLQVGAVFAVNTGSRQGAKTAKVEPELTVHDFYVF